MQARLNPIAETHAPDEAFAVLRAAFEPAEPIGLRSQHPHAHPQTNAAD